MHRRVLHAQSEKKIYIYAATKSLSFVKYEVYFIIDEMISDENIYPSHIIILYNTDATKRKLND